MNSVWFNETHAVATDGHRMAIVPRELVPEFGIGFTNKLYNFKTHEMNDETQAESWRSVRTAIKLADKPSWVGEMPLLFKGVKSTRRQLVSISMDLAGGFHTVHSVDMIGFNVEYLAPLTGVEVKCYAVTPTMPVLFQLDNGVEYIVMPLRR
jgi:hypothetical protein